MNKDGMKAIAKHFGLVEQLEKLKEEADELIEALEKGDYENTVEEIADVMLVSREVNFLCSEFVKKNKDNALVEKLIDYKIARVFSRMRRGYYETDK